jgi:VWFA-related protein
MYCAIALLIALSFTALSSNPQTTQPTPQDQSPRLRADLVTIDVLPVQKRTGHTLPNLTRTDFTISEDGVKQTISHFSREELPISILLLVDRAGCVNAFSDQIRTATIDAVGKLKPEDEVGIMTFSNRVDLVQPFTHDRKLVGDKIMAVEHQHRSEQHYFNAAIYDASEYMQRAANPAGRRAIIVLTSLEASIDFSKRSEKEALHAVLESGATVSGVLVKTLGGRIEQGVRGKPTSVLRHLGLRSGSLKMFVEETGGQLVNSPPDQMASTLTRIVADLSASYSLAFAPTNSARDGKRRRIRVELAPEIEKREGQVALLARRSYIMPLEAALSDPAKCALDPRIPAPAQEKITPVRDAAGWVNPYFVIKTDGVAITLKAISQEYESVPIEELASRVSRLPLEAWPYGRVVAVQEIGIRSGNDNALIARNRASVEKILTSLGLTINWWPSA